jgi:hypothetical protein
VAHLLVHLVGEGLGDAAFEVGGHGVSKSGSEPKTR